MKNSEPTFELRDIAALIPYARNSRTHGDAQVAQLAGSLDEFGMVGAIVVRNGVIAKGHGTLAAIRQIYAAGQRLYPAPGKVAGAKPYPNGTVPVLDVTGWSEAQFRAYVIADNQLAMNAGWDTDLLRVELGDLRDLDFDLSLLGFGQSELKDLLDKPEPSAPGSSAAPAKLADKLLVPPFSVLNAREGYWQERKAAWLALGIESEIGRGDKRQDCIKAGTPGMAYAGGRMKKGDACIEQGGVSIFDPVLCELVYRWFSPVDAIVLDSFAGGSVRGIVAAKLGRQYVGGELRQIQVDANRAQADSIIKGDEPMPVWHCGDSRDLDLVCGDLQADFLFTCPPYADLEVYSDDLLDLSTMAYPDFLTAYREIIAKSCGLLKNDRFACIVVGEVRDKKGAYRDFVGDTVQAFRDAGLTYYNEMILVTQAGSLPLRAGKQFSASRKAGKTHQNVLVFLKGNWKRAVEACGAVEISDECFGEIPAEE